jgi:hypothetical protein
MTLENKTYTFTYNSPENGDGTIMETITVPDGELWYIDELYAFADPCSTGDNAGINAETGAKLHYALDIADNRSSNQLASSIVEIFENSTMYRSTSSTVDAYVGDEGSLLVRLRNHNSYTTGGTLRVRIGIRRVQ